MSVAFRSRSTNRASRWWLADSPSLPAFWLTSSWSNGGIDPFAAALEQADTTAFGFEHGDRGVVRLEARYPLRAGGMSSQDVDRNKVGEDHGIVRACQGCLEHAGPPTSQKRVVSGDQGPAEADQLRPFRMQRPMQPVSPGQRGGGWARYLSYPRLDNRLPAPECT